MTMHDKLFLAFVFVFYVSAILLAVWMREAGISAVLGTLLGAAYQSFLQTRSSRIR